MHEMGSNYLQHVSARRRYSDVLWPPNRLILPVTGRLIQANIKESWRSVLLVLCERNPQGTGGSSHKAWWRNQMKTFSALMALRAGNSPVTGEFPAQNPVTRSLDFFFDLRLNKRLSKQSWGWWFKTPSRSYDDIAMGPMIRWAFPCHDVSLLLTPHRVYSVTPYDL